VAGRRLQSVHWESLIAAILAEEGWWLKQEAADGSSHWPYADTISGAILFTPAVMDVVNITNLWEEVKMEEDASQVKDLGEGREDGESTAGLAADGRVAIRLMIF
jgi:hypothetical protein